MRLPLTMILTSALLGGTVSGQTPAVRLKEILRLHEVRPNTLVGRGIVTGLRKTGDGTEATRQALVNFLTKMNLKVRNDQVAAGNVALVHVTAQLPPFARHGTRLDVSVNSIGEASSLQGGTLLLTELKGPDGVTYALANGPLMIGGFEAAGTNAKVIRNHPTAGTIPDGAVCEPPVEEIVPDNLNERGELTFLLLRPSAETARRTEQAINGLLTQKNCGYAEVLDQGLVSCKLVPAYRSRQAVTKLIAAIESLRIEPDLDARIILNEKTGTIIVGSDVRVSPCMVQVADLTIEVIDEEIVSQPLPGFNQGTTERVGRTRVTVTQETGKPQQVSGGASLSDLIQGLQSLGIDGPKMMTVLTEMHRAGYVHAELVAR